MEIEQLVTVTEAAEMVNIPARELSRLCKLATDNCPYVLVGKTVKVYPSEVDRYLHKRQVRK